MRPGMDGASGAEQFETVIIGGGQAGLSVGYHLARQGRRFVILDANQRIGDPWRTRWDSLRLFTPARYNGLPGWPFPAPAWSFPGKDEMADYLEAYAARFDLPVRTGVRVDRLFREGDRYVMAAAKDRLEADNVVVAGAPICAPGSPRSPPSSTRASSSCTPAGIGIHPSCRRAASWSSGPPTRGPRSPWRCPGSTGPGCRAGIPARNPTAPEAAGGIGFSSRWSGSWPPTC
jgi:Pyridine nucleotide-disulphide oxidoreductase